MSEIDNGGPAFPTQETWGAGSARGLTKREWFAGMALAGYFAAPNTPHQNATNCAEYIFEMADAMLAESKKGQADA